MPVSSISCDAVSFYLLGERAAVLQAEHAIKDLTDIEKVQFQRRIWGAAQALRQRGCCIDIVPGMHNLTAIFDPLLHTGSNMLSALQSCWESSQEIFVATREIQIPVCYGGQFGPDLEVVALHNQLEPEDVVRLHSEAHYLVYFLGFQPGFAYLGGLPAQLATPRRSEPRISVPAGSVGIGGTQTGIYPAASPGGWQLIGRSQIKLFDPSQASATLLQPGDLVRFTVERIDA
jgi:KipI family sensor histidine kinase inhibitor